MNSDKKKRLIIPVATLMVAIVMMAGVGYAAVSSTFTVDKNTTVGVEFKVTIDGHESGSKLFTDAKIPYGVNTTNGNVKNTVYAGNYVLVEDKTVTVTDKTGLGTYTITTGVTSPNLKNALGEGNYTFDVSLVESTTGTADSNVKTYTLNVGLKVTSNVDIDNVTKLNVSDITVTITATHE